MGITTSQKNQIDAISNNLFLKKIYTNDIFLSAHIIGVNLHGGNTVTFTLQTQEKPIIEIDKWGRFGLDYNTVCIELTAGYAESLTLKEWKVDIPVIGVNIIDDGQLISITSISSTVFKLIARSLNFQRCSTYILSSNDDTT